jgi:hypothetical protein
LTTRVAAERVTVCFEAAVSISRALANSETEEGQGGRRPESEGVRRLDRAFRVRLERSQAEPAAAADQSLNLLSGNYG